MASRCKGSWKIKSLFKIAVHLITKLRTLGLWKQVRKERVTTSNWGLIRHVGKGGEQDMIPCTYEAHSLVQETPKSY